MTPDEVKAECDAIAAANPGWRAWCGRNRMWHARSGRLEAHGGSAAELRQSVRDARRQAGAWA